jgi:sporulation protein YlmC with PRC-barrel domain
MADTTQFKIGDHVSCTDGACGQVTRVVVNPVARVVTHIVVEPKHTMGQGRLVPLELIESTDGDVRLGCTIADFDKLEYAEEADFLPGTAGYGGYSSGQVLSLPYFGLGAADAGVGMGDVAQPVLYERVPVGEVTVRRGEQVHATDGDIGKVQGLVIDSRDHHVTHVLLQEGHFWGRKQVAIPIGAITGVDEGIRLNISKQQVQDLPPVDVDHRDG